jgi:hypothetical protein
VIISGFRFHCAHLPWHIEFVLQAQINGPMLLTKMSISARARFHQVLKQWLPSQLRLPGVRMER